jgi:hypothetical protein
MAPASPASERQNGVAATATPKRRRDRKDDVEFKGFCRRMIRAYGRRAAEADPWVLGDLLSLRADMDEAIADAVTAYKAAGLSWQAIADELGIDRVTCFKRYAHLVRQDAQASA